MGMEIFQSIDFQMFIRLCLAALLGGLVGMERGSGDKPAGLRTHVLVCTGSALFTLVSIYGFDRTGGGTAWDASRIAAQIVSGIGFLGAGTILHEGLTVRGLTTAASLWIIAAVGMAVGSGMIILAIVATVLTLITLVTFHDLEKKLPGVASIERRYIRVVLTQDPDSIPALLELLSEKHVKVRTINVKNDSENREILVDLYLKITREQDANEVVAEVNALSCVLRIENIV